MMRYIFFASMVLLLHLSPLYAAEIQIVSQPTGFSLLEPQSPPPPNPSSYASTSSGANWHIASWDIPEKKLSAFQQVSNGQSVIFTSNAPEASVKLTLSQFAKPSYELSQNGVALPCLLNGKPYESDLLAGPNNKNAHAPDVNGMLVVPGQLPLTSMTHLVANATVGLRYTEARPSKGCDVTQGSPLISVILNNATAHQTLFYKVVLALLCGEGLSEQRTRWCHSSVNNPQSHFYFQQNPYGVDDPLPLLGQPWMQNGEVRSFQLDLLPRLLNLIANGPPTMDRDFQHWTLGTYYNGQHIWGDLNMSTSWNDISLVAYTP